jgi:hypothetical protein
VFTWTFAITVTVEPERFTIALGLFLETPVNRSIEKAAQIGEHGNISV